MNLSVGILFAPLHQVPSKRYLPERGANLHGGMFRYKKRGGINLTNFRGTANHIFRLHAHAR